MTPELADKKSSGDEKGAPMSKYREGINPLYILPFAETLATPREEGSHLPLTTRPFLFFVITTSSCLVLQFGGEVMYSKSLCVHILPHLCTSYREHGRCKIRGEGGDDPEVIFHLCLRNRGIIIK